ncbi:MAG: hypothetical protein AAFP16_03050 [Pseudomonadota bacterium]
MDYLDKLVARKLTAHVGTSPALAQDAAPMLTNILPYFPLQPIANDQVRSAAWPLIDNQLSPTNPIVTTTTSFSASFAGFLSNTNLQDGPPAERLALATQQTTAKKNITSSDRANGGLCYKPGDTAAAACSFVPGYAATWPTEPGLGPLKIRIDVWRPNAASPWKPASGQPRGERLRASLTYSAFRIVELAPAALNDTTGWYSQPLLDGLRDGIYRGVRFDRQGGFGPTGNFVRAAVFVMVGRVQFSKETNSTTLLSNLLEKPKRQLRTRRGGVPVQKLRMQLTPNLILPPGKLVPPRSVTRGLNMSTDWDTGDIYAESDAGFIVCAVPDAPLRSGTAD